MKTYSWRDPATKVTNFQSSLNDMDLIAAASPEAVMAEVRHQLAKAIVEKIMEKLGPALDAALKEVGKP